MYHYESTSGVIDFTTAIEYLLSKTTLSYDEAYEFVDTVHDLGADEVRGAVAHAVSPEIIGLKRIITIALIVSVVMIVCYAIKKKYKKVEKPA